MRKYIEKRPRQIVDAIQWDGVTCLEGCELTKGSIPLKIAPQLKVPSPDMLKYASKGDYIYRDKEGVMRIMKKETFEATYEEYDED